MSSGRNYKEIARYMSMIEGGKGGTRTQTGLRFEERVDLKQVFEQIEGYEVKANKLFFKGEEVAQFYQKYKLYKELLEPAGVEWKKIIKKRLLPDEALLVLKTKTLFIIEIKFQKTAGSVDEKLQTCDFKRKQYVKLAKELGLQVEYMYILNDWFDNESYEDTLDYIKSVGCEYHFNEIPLETLGLPSVE
jgi:hypothetical protein